jgi:hypothetical protein
MGWSCAAKRMGLATEMVLMYSKISYYSSIRCSVAVRLRSFLFATASRPFLGQNQPPIKWARESHSPAVQHGRSATLTSQPSSVKISIEASCIFTGPYVFLEWCLIKHGNNLIFRLHPVIRMEGLKIITIYLSLKYIALHWTSNDWWVKVDQTGRVMRDYSAGILCNSISRMVVVATSSSETSVNFYQTWYGLRFPWRWLWRCLSSGL